MKKTYSVVGLCLCVLCNGSIFNAKSQTTTLTLRPGPSDGMDASIRDDDPNGNYGNDVNFIANAWTAVGDSFHQRSLINFDFSLIPANATIVNATLSLWCNLTSGHTQLHSSLSGSNQCHLQRITSNWSENIVTWNTQPTTTTMNEVLVPQSTSMTENYPNIDVTNLVKDILNNLSTSYGFMFRLDTEFIYRAMVFASSDHPDSTWRPKLVIVYLLPENCTVLFIPNAFTPNEDGVNDEYKLYSPCVEEIDLNIFNRWGQMIFSSNDITGGWDGKYRGRSQPVGVYVLLAKGRFTNGETFNEKRTIALIR